MDDLHLILSVPQGFTTATTLGVEAFARHLSPGSGKYFQGRSIYFDLALEEGRPAFTYLEEGGWRNAEGDTLAALRGAGPENRTKTALSNNAFSCTPISAHRNCFLVRTGGQVLQMEPATELCWFSSHDYTEAMTPDQVAQAISMPTPDERTPRLYMVLSPTEFLVLSTLTPLEYAWYATHRPRKIFRQLVFAELWLDQTHVAAESRFQDARALLTRHPLKKTKTIVTEDCFNRVPFSSWVGYRHRADGGLYVGDRDRLLLWRFPSEIPVQWEKAEG